MEQLLVVVVVTAITSLLLRSAKRPARFSPSENAFVLRYPRTFVIIGWVFGILPALGIVIMILFVRPQNRGDWIAVIAMILGFSSLGGILINEGRAYLLLLADGIHSFSPWRGHIDLHWSDIRTVKFSRLLQWFVIRTNSGEVIRAHNYMGGLSTLFEHFQDHLKPEIFQEAKRKYEALSCDGAP